MIICNEFIVLNLPKTGSTFVRKVINEIYVKRMSSNVTDKICYALNLKTKPFKELLLPNIKVPGKPDQHGTYSQIPPKYLNRKVISVVRNPYDRFLSAYEFKNWARVPSLSKDVLLKHFPHFPDLTLDDYVELNKLDAQVRLKSKNKINLGNQTVQFIQMFFKEPEKVLSKITEEYIDSDIAYIKDMGNVHFLTQENLNDQLSTFLEKNGFSEEEVAFARNYDRVNTTKPLFKDRDNLWTEKALNYVEENERFIFKILNDKGITYERPNFLNKVAQ